MPRRKLLVTTIFLISGFFSTTGNVYSQPIDACGELFASADANNDGLISEEEYAARFSGVFAKYFSPADADGDGDGF